MRRKKREAARTRPQRSHWTEQLNNNGTLLDELDASNARERPDMDRMEAHCT